MGVGVCARETLRETELIHSSSSLWDVPEFQAAAALDDGDIKEEMLQRFFIAVFHILCNRM